MPAKRKTRTPDVATLAARYTATTPPGWKVCSAHSATFSDFCDGCANEVGFASARAAGDHYDQRPDGSTTKHSIAGTTDVETLTRERHHTRRAALEEAAREVDGLIPEERSSIRRQAYGIAAAHIRALIAK